MAAPRSIASIYGKVATSSIIDTSVGCDADAYASAQCVHSDCAEIVYCFSVTTDGLLVVPMNKGAVGQESRTRRSRGLAGGREFFLPYTLSNIARIDTATAASFNYSNSHLPRTSGRSTT